MTIVSRLQLDHPALGTAGGAGLHSQIEAIYTKIGNNMADRYFLVLDLNDATSTDLDHNFRCAFDDLRVDLYLYDEGTTELTQITAASTPPISDFTIAATPGFLTTKLRVTNNSGAQRDLVAIVLHDPINLAELENIDLATNPPEDGQALVYQSSNSKWVAGASGDASFKIQSITDPNAVIKGGYLLIDDQRELATYDGAGSASTDYGKDLTVSLDTIFGGNPVDATAYYLYIDLLTLGSQVTLTDNGRKVYGITEANFELSTLAPEDRDPSRYIPLGFIRSADTGTVWSGTGATFGTLAFRRHETLTRFFAYPETFVDEESIVAAAASNTLNHNLSGEPHSIMLTYDDGVTEIGLDPSAHLLDVTASQIKVASLGLTFGGGQKLRVRAVRFPTQPALASSSRQFVSGWFTDTATTTLPHGLNDSDDIKGYVVEEWDVTANKYRLIDPTSLVVNFDSTNFYLNWTGLSPSGTLQYRVIAGSSPLVYSIPLPYGGYTKFVGIGPGSYATLTAALAAASSGDRILITRAITESAGISVPAGVEVDQMPGALVTFSATGFASGAIRLTGAKAAWRRLNAKVTGITATLAKAISVEAADCKVDGDLDIDCAGQTVTDAVEIAVAGERAKVEVGVKNTASVAITNLVDNQDGAGSVNVYGG